MRYTVVVHDEPEPDRVRYWAEVLEMPGCFTQGDTLEDIMANVREAALLYREGQEAEFPAPSAFLMQIEVPA